MINQPLTIEYDPELSRTKIAITLRRKNFSLALFSLALLVWIGMLVAILVYLLEGHSTSVVLTLLLFAWLLTWLAFGRFLWKKWQYFAAGREILFIDEVQIIIRRPVSLLGITNAYDKNSATPFYYSDTHKCPAFDYAYLHVYFGQDLDAAAARELIDTVNKRWFPRPEAVE